MKGKVYLVGGGPGDPELLTLKARRLIGEADCLVYDRLIDPRILREAREDCEKIYVGKQNRHHSMKQEDINRLLVKKAGQRRTVVRLKGGDVYVFGRGGEEALYLREHQIPFEIVPGISSCMAGLAYAGIPITHRGLAGGFHVVTAHDRRDGLADLDFKAMAESTDTCVFMMGLSMLGEIAERLMAAGKPGGTEAAVISNATLPSQKVVAAPLQRIAREVERQALSSPALIVVGAVAGLRKQLNFYEEKPLFGLRALLPRAGNRPSALGGKLEALGADVYEVQTSRLEGKEKALDHVCYQDYSYIILTSKNAVDYFMDSLHRNRVDIRSLNGITFAVVGSATREYLESFGIYASVMPGTFHQDALFEELKQCLGPGDRILFPKGEVRADKEQAGRCGGDKGLADKLAEICPTDVVELYENVRPEDADIPELPEGRRFDMAVFTCSSCVKNTLGQARSASALEQAKIVSIGEKTSETLRSFGVTELVQSEEATFDSLVQTITALYGTIRQQEGYDV